jgi:hypothetical protein
MTRGYRLAWLVFGLSIASSELVAEPVRYNSDEERSVAMPKLEFAAVGPQGTTVKPAVIAGASGAQSDAAGRIVLAQYIPIGKSKMLPRSFRGPRQAPNRAVPVSPAVAPNELSTPGQMPPARANAVAPAAGAAGDPPHSLEGQTAKNDSTPAAVNRPQGAQPIEMSQTKLAGSENVAQPQSSSPAAARAPVAQSAPAGQQQVGEAPDKRKEVNIPALADRGGVLTPRGTLVADTSTSYTHTSVNRFFFEGVELVDAVLIGDFQAEDIDRNSVSQSFGARYGLTNRLEISTGISFIARSDREVNTALVTSDPNRVLQNDGAGFGDIDFGIQYQINKPSNGSPFFVANLRGKTVSGKGPFDVKRNLQTGLETELPTGSGFWGFEPSVSVIWPSDPAVLYANLGYRVNLKRSVNKLIQDRFEEPSDPNAGPVSTRRTTIFINDVDPGDSLSASFGVGFGLNDQISMSLGYSHTWVFGTTTDQTQTKYLLSGAVIPPGPGIDPATQDGPRIRGVSTSAGAQVGSLLIGTSVNVSPGYGFSVNLGAGLTADAPDVSISFRWPLSFRLSR